MTMQATASESDGSPASAEAMHVTVIDYSETIAAHFAASTLAARGARVIRGRSRQAGAGASSPTERFVSRGVILEPPDAATTDPSHLLEQADVLIVSGPSGAWGTLAEVRGRFPQLVIVAMTPMGLNGPEAARPMTGLTLAAESGFLGITGRPGRPPEQVRGNVPELACGWAGATAVWAALRNRKMTGSGALVDLSLLEVYVFLQWNATQRAAFEGVVMQRQGSRGAGHPWGIYPCQDGHVILIVGAGGRNWIRFAELMGIPELADPRFNSPRTRAEHADEIDALMYPWLLQHTADDIFTSAQAIGLPFGMVVRPRDLPDDPQLKSRGFFRWDDDGIAWPQLPFRINGRRPAWTTNNSANTEATI